MIRIKDLYFSYKKNAEVLKGIELQWESGRIHGLMGSNGSGKSTLFYCIKGLRKDYSGEISLEKEPGENPKLTDSEIAFLPAENYFYPRMMASEYLHFFTLNNPNFEPAHWLEIMDLPGSGIVDNFSTGMKKKLAIIGCMGLDKAILILDEPFNGLDAESFQLVQEILLQENKKGKTIILSSHISSSLKEICQDIAYLEDGRIKSIFQAKDFTSMDAQLFEKKREELRRKIL
ncbi:ATP-binding cassette domain-containing protein [Hyphobacterium sp. CCMP332]|nr:ATP-binding cassette domain-containing protein [Hyphobacterium sp. CCMP332]